MKDHITVCHFGFYDREYSRNKILSTGLKANSVRVLECRSEQTGWRKYLDLMVKHWRIRNAYDIMLVGFPGHLSVLVAKLLTRKPIVFDAFVSLHDSALDRKTVHPRGLASRYYWLLDKLSMSLADLILFDTNQHIDFASATFRIPRDKFKRVLVGADTEIFLPSAKRIGDKFRVLFFGRYIPLQGVEYILRAAKLLESQQDVEFELVGGGQEKGNILQLARTLQLTNVVFVDSVPLRELAGKIANADVCLGIFGATEKAQRVIPNKVYEALAMRKTVITADTPAIRELLTDNAAVLVETASAASISAGIVQVKDAPRLAKEVATQGYEIFRTLATPEILGGQVKAIMIEVLSSQ